MKQDLNQAKNSSQTLTLVYSELRDVWMVLPASELMRPQVGREDVLNLTTRINESFVGIEPLLPKVFSGERSSEIQKAHANVDNAALGYYKADMDWENALVIPPGVDTKKQTAQVREDDRRLMDWSVGPFRDNEDAQLVLADIRKGAGRRDDAEDVIRLVGLYRKYDVRTVEITDDYLNQAEQRATAQINLLRTAQPDITGSVADLRRRAYTHWATAYNTIVRAGRYITEDVTEATTRFPGAHATRTPAPKPNPPL